MGEMVIMNDLEWPMLSYYVIYYEKFKNGIQQKEGCFKWAEQTGLMILQDSEDNYLSWLSTMTGCRFWINVITTSRQW